jgi:hypothetical protein
VKWTPCVSRMVESKTHSRCWSENLLNRPTGMQSRGFENNIKMALEIHGYTLWLRIILNVLVSFVFFHDPNLC